MWQKRISRLSSLDFSLKNKRDDAEVNLNVDRDNLKMKVSNKDIDMDAKIGLTDPTLVYADIVSDTKVDMVVHRYNEKLDTINTFIKLSEDRAKVEEVITSYVYNHSNPKTLLILEERMGEMSVADSTIVKCALDILDPDED